MTALPAGTSDAMPADASTSASAATPVATTPARGRSAVFWGAVALVISLAVLGGGQALATDARLALGLAAVAITLVAALEDLRTRRIRNVLTAPALVFALCGAQSYPAAALGMLVAPLPLLALVLLQPRGMGMGDVKLAAVAGALVGLRAVPAWWMATALAGGVLAVVAIIRGGRRGSTMAYGPALVAALLWVLFGPVAAG